MSAVILQHVIFVCCLSDSFWAETRCWYHCTKSKANRTCKQFLALVCSVLSVKSHPSGSPNFSPNFHTALTSLSTCAHHTLSPTVVTSCDVWCDQRLLSFAGRPLSINKRRVALFCIGLLPVAPTRWQPAALLPVSPPL